MTATNTATRYGTVTKTFHWLTALLILTNIALGLLAENLSAETQLALKAQTFTIHKTVGLAIFAVALLRILWALAQPKPVSLHPDRSAETLLAELVHWTLYASLVLIPLSGWISHAATEGFAPIWWPLPQNLPGLVESEAIYRMASTAHWLFNILLGVALALHLLGALKHHLVDRDATLKRMWFGRTEAGNPRKATHGPGPALPLAVAIYFGAGLLVFAWTADALVPQTETATGPAAGGGNWAVQSGEIAIAVEQFGSTVEGGFDQWSADITFDEATGTGAVTVEIDISSLSLGSTTEDALGPNYFDAATHPTTTFDAEITPEGDAYTATGTLELSGETAEVTLPFTLTIEGDTATMQGETTLNRRAYGIGETQDDNTVGPEVPVTIALTATRAE